MTRIESPISCFADSLHVLVMVFINGIFSLRLNRASVVDIIIIFFFYFVLVRCRWIMEVCRCFLFISRLIVRGVVGLR